MYTPSQNVASRLCSRESTNPTNNNNPNNRVLRTKAECKALKIAVLFEYLHFNGAQLIQ